LSLAFGIEDGQAVGAPDIPVNHPLSQAARAVRERKELYATADSDGLSMLLPGTRPMLAALFDPLIVAERVLGVVSIQSDESNAYSENERSIFRTLCAYAAIALDNAAAYRKLAGTIDMLRSTQSELALRTAEFERLSLTDPLTAVANRRSLDECAAVAVAEMTRKGGRLAVAMVDIDHFKAVNDTHGHAIGDTVLRRVARIAKALLRPGDFIARVGGEEFALLLPGAGMREAVYVAERIRCSIAETPMTSGDDPIYITSSFGVAEFDPTSDTFDTALRRADAALYAAKQAGRNRVHSVPT
jgi:diguanylate cyclase (GGDEF)-like protein